MSQRFLLRKTWRDLGRRRSQIVAVSITVFLGIFMFAANNDAAANLNRSYEQLYDQLGFGDVWATGGPTDELVDTLVADPDVDAVMTRTRFDTPLRIGDRQLVGTVIGVPVDTEPPLNRLLVLEGEGPSADTADTSATIEQHGWDEFDLALGDTIEVRGEAGWTELELSGAAASAEYIWLAPSRQQVFTVPDEFAVVFVAEPLAAQLAPDAPTQVVAGVRGSDPDTATRLADELTALGASDSYTRAEQASNTALQGDVTGFEQLSFLFPVLFLTVAGMAAFVLLNRMVRTERPHIGMMAANGISARTIRWHYTSHAAVAVLLGAVPGLVLGALVGRWISGLYTDFVDVPITVVEFSLGTVLWSVAFALVVTLVAGGLPARAAARIQPAAAMRPPTPRVVTDRSLVERLWPGDLPRWARMVARNVSRSRRRFWSTVLGVVLAMMLVITSFGLSDTVFGLVDEMFDEVELRDLTVTLDEPVTDADLAAIEGRDGVAAAERFAEVPVSVADGTGGSADQLLQVFPTDTVAHGFADRDGPPAQGILLGASARDALDADVGDAVTVVVARPDARLETTVAGFVDEPVPSVAYVSLDQWAEWGAPPTDTVSVMLTDRSTHEQARDALQGEPGVAAVVDQRASAEALQELMGLTYVFIGLMVAFALVMAISLVYNMVSVSLAERTGEVATLQANGVDRGFIRRTVTGENALTVLTGVVPGTILGWAMATVFLGQFETESIRFDLILHPRSIVIAVVLVTVSALLAEWPGLRALDRLDLATIVRERSE